MPILWKDWQLKYKLRINLKENRERRCKGLNENEKIWLIEFLNWSDITFTNCSFKGHVCLGKFEAKENRNKGNIYCGRCMTIFQLQTVIQIQSRLKAKLANIFLSFEKNIYETLNILHTSCLCKMSENSPIQERLE